MLCTQKMETAHTPTKKTTTLAKKESHRCVIHLSNIFFGKEFFHFCGL